MKLLFASSNVGKVAELRKLVPAGFTLLSLADVGFTGEIPETGTTLQENAWQKAVYLSEAFEMPCFADDSGLEVDALQGAPGVYSARFAGLPKSDERNMDKLLALMQNEPNRQAQFRTVIALNLNGDAHFFEGLIRGHILSEKQGTQGFGYDPVFRPQGFDCTFAQMSLEDKNSISHRAQAVNKLVDFLKQRGL